MRRREQGLRFLCVYMYVYIFIQGMTKTQEKSLRLGITLWRGATQVMSLGVAKLQGQQCGGRQRAGRRGRSPLCVSVQSSSGLWVSCPGWLTAAAGALWYSRIQAAQQIAESFPAEAAAFFLYQSCHSSKRQGCSWTPLSRLSFLLSSLLRIQGQVPQVATASWNLCMGPTSSKCQSLPLGQQTEQWQKSVLSVFF